MGEKRNILVQIAQICGLVSQEEKQGKAQQHRGQSGEDRADRFHVNAPPKS